MGYFVYFFGKPKISKRHSEINWPLKELDLNGNNISNVDADSLKGLVNLETINLGLNPIEYVPKGTV